MKRIIYILVLCIGGTSSYAWNALGHKVVAQIAYDNLSANAKMLSRKYLDTHVHNSSESKFVSASIWMDQIRFKKIYWYDVMHYIDIPFSNDGSRLPEVNNTNAVWAIKNAILVFSSSNTSTSDKRLALRMLIHVTGDIHQPLHAVTRVSEHLPNGDLGGNLFPLGKNPVGNNLHQYWDNGAGFFLGKNDVTHVKRIARQLEEKWPCASINADIQPAKWAKMSHKLAINNAYQLNPKETPDHKYQKNAQNLVQKQAVYAGCRLAAVLNKLADA